MSPDKTEQIRQITHHARQLTVDLDAALAKGSDPELIAQAQKALSSAITILMLAVKLGE